MKLVTAIYSFDELENLKDSLDMALISVPNLSINYKDIDVDAALDFCHKNNITPILSINRIMHPTDLESINSFIDSHINELFMCADLGVVNLFIKKNKIANLIYNPETMITNYKDASIYASLGLNAIGISSEITLLDLKEIYDKTNANIYYQGFGKRLMFYSRRKLITSYSIKNNTNYPKEGYLKEATRNDMLPFVENEEATLIYRPYNISLLTELENNSFIKYLFIESYDIDKCLFKSINEIYYDSVVNGNIRENILKLKELNINIEDGFFYKDSVYQKEELKK